MLKELQWDDRIAVRIADLDPASLEEGTERAARTFASIRNREDTLRRETTAALLDNYNKNWHGDDDDSKTAPMDAETFEHHLTLTDVTFYADGSAELYYDDGGLFLGHTVVVGTDESGQFLRATLAG